MKVRYSDFTQATRSGTVALPFINMAELLATASDLVVRVPVQTIGSMTTARIRVIDLVTGGNGQNEVCEIGWQDVVQDDQGRWSVNEERGALLVNPGRPMSPETMAVHHILDAQVADAPFWKEAAPGVLRPPGTVTALAAHRAAFEQQYCTPRLAGGLPWICTWKCAMQQQVISAFQSIPRFIMQMVGSVILLSALSWQLALPAVIWITLNVLLAVRLAPVFTERARRSAKRRSLISGAITDLYANMQMVKQFAAEDSEAGAIRGIIGKAIKAQQSEQRIYRTAEVIVVVLNMMHWLAILSIGFTGLVDGFVTIGEFTAAVYVLSRLSGHTFTFLQMGQQIFQAIGTIKGAMPVMTTPPTITDRPDAAEHVVHRGEIRFENVRFAYKSGRPVIDALSLTIRPGEKVGLVGLSGAEDNARKPAPAFLRPH